MVFLMRFFQNNCEDRYGKAVFPKIIDIPSATEEQQGGAVSHVKSQCSVA